MAKIQLKGIVKRVMPVETYGQDKSGRRQSVILFVPGYVDQFGDKRGQDEEWQLDLFNDRIDKFNLNGNLHEKRVVVDVYVNSRKILGRDGQDLWIINAALGDIKLHEPNANTQNENGNAQNSW